MDQFMLAFTLGALSVYLIEKGVEYGSLYLKSKVFKPILWQDIPEHARHEIRRMMRDQ